LVQTLGGPGPHYLQGDSFGTAWGQRIVAIFPNLFDCGVFESFLVPGLWNFFDAPANLDQIMRSVLGYCRKDIWCNSHTGTGSDPEVMLTRFLNSDITTAYCFPYLNKTMYPQEIPWRQLFQQMMSVFFTGDRNALALIPVSVRILLEFYTATQPIPCTISANLMFSWWKFYESISASSRAPFDPCDISNPVLYNLFLSEGSLKPPSEEDIYNNIYSSLASPPVDIMLEGITLHQLWPLYTTPYNNAIPRTTKPLFYFNGDLDGSTPLANAVVYADQMTSYTFRLLPTVPHVGFLLSPVEGSPIPCGLDMISKFFLNKCTSVDDSCIQKLVPLDFPLTSNSTRNLSTLYFGTSDPWAILMNQR